MLCISNLRPPASKAGKQPPLSFQFCRFTSIFFSGRQPEPKFSVNLCGLCEIVHYRIYFFLLSSRMQAFRTRSTRETVGKVNHYLNRPFAESKGIEPSLLSQNSLAVSRNKPVFAYSPFVIPEGFEPSTFDVSGRCSNQLSYEIVFLFCELLIVNSLYLSIFNLLMK